MDIYAWPDNLANNIAKHAGKEISEYIMRGSRNLDKMNGAGKAKWVREALQRMQEKILDSKIRQLIISESCCRFNDSYISQLRNEYQRLNDIDKLLEYLHGKTFLNKPERDGDNIYVTKAPYNPEQYARAKTLDEKRRAFCHCQFVREAEKAIPLEYCYCGAGWCRHIWEGILEKPVRVEIIQSVMDGDEVCKFAVYID